MTRPLARTQDRRALLVRALVAMLAVLVVTSAAPEEAFAQGRGIIIPPSRYAPVWGRVPNARQPRARRGAMRFGGWRRPRGSRPANVRRWSAASRVNSGRMGTATSALAAVTPDRAREDSAIVVAGGTAQPGEVEHVRRAILPMVPAEIVRRLEAEHVRVVVAHDSVLDVRPEWAERPPLDEFETSWDAVPAMYDAERRELIVAAPAGAGEGPDARDSLTQDWVFHQIGHALDALVGAEHDSTNSEFATATTVIVLERRHPTVRPLTREEAREVFAVSFAMFHLAPEQLHEWHPRLVHYWQQHRAAIAPPHAPPEPQPAVTVAVMAQTPTTAVAPAAATGPAAAVAAHVPANRAVSISR